MTDELREEYRKYSVCGFLPKPFDTKLLRTYLFTTQLLHEPAPVPDAAFHETVGQEIGTHV
jgi:hypothetical protein